MTPDPDFKVATFFDIEYLQNNTIYSRYQDTQKFPTPMYFMPQLTGFPLELGISTRGQKTRMMVYQLVEKSLQNVNSHMHSIE